MAVDRPVGSLVFDTRTAPALRPVSRGLLFVALCIACLVVASGYAVLAARRTESAATRLRAVPVGAPEAIATLRAQPHVVFRSTALGETYGKVALAPLNALDGPRYPTTLECDRVHFAAGQGLCLAVDRGVFTTYWAYSLDEDFQPRYSFPLSGVPSRARLSPDGRHAALTVFISGHSYAEGGFSTQTLLIDTASGAVLSDLEQFTVWRDGAPFQAPDFNFWGVTFARDSNRFYATLASGGKTYLVEGDLAAREARVLHANAECPSLSPDNTRLVFKKRVGTGGRVVWQLHVLDLATLAETPLAETRNVDDQVEWLDDSHVLYALPEEGPPSSAVTDMWVLPVDGSGPPRLLLPQAYSPAIVH